MSDPADNPYLTPEAPLENTDETKLVSKDYGPSGLGGWLTLVAIGLIITPLRTGFMLSSIYMPIFQDGQIAVFIDNGSEYYNPGLFLLLLAEIIFNLLNIAGSLLLLYLFFNRKKTFPGWYIGLMLFSLIGIFVDAVLSGFIFPEEPMFDPDTTSELVRALVGASIWIPYMLMSVRVKNTFIR
jgi:hypothetical protein